MDVTLTSGAIRKILDGEVTSEKDMVPVLQVTELRLLQSKDKLQERFAVKLSDGTSSVEGVLVQSLTSLVNEGLVQAGSIVRLTLFHGELVMGELAMGQRVLIVIKELQVIPVQSSIIAQNVQGPKATNNTTSFETDDDDDIIGDPVIEAKADDDIEIQSSDAHMSTPSSDGTFVPATQDYEVLKENASKAIKIFRERLSEAKGFIRDTRTTKDQIQATIRCVNRLIKKFNEFWKEVSGLEEELGRTHADDSELLRCDQLRLNARNILRFFRNKTLNSFVKSISPLTTCETDDTRKTLLKLDDFLEENQWLIYNVMHKGDDGISDSEENVSDDDEHLFV